MAKLLILALSAVVFTTHTSLASDTPTITPHSKELLVQAGAAQDLNCSVTTVGDGKLQWTYPVEGGKQPNAKEYMHVATSDGRLTSFSNLHIHNFDTINAGLYKCSLVKNDTVVSESEISLVAVQENKTEPKFVPEEKSANLSCDISFDAERSISSITWLKVTNKSSVRNVVFVSQLKNKDSYKEENSSLTINNPKIDDTGLYIARFAFSDDESNTYDCQVAFESGPMVQAFDKPKNLIEGEKMELKCIIKGYPPAVVTWYKDNNVLNDSRLEILKAYDEHQIVSLLVSKVEFGDAGDYTCEAYSEHLNVTSRQTLAVRVKDKLAALWPFLGIVGEVVVLCTIIFIYEKRRNKQVQQEEKAAEEVDGSATDKKEGLRHRNTNSSA